MQYEDEKKKGKNCKNTRTLPRKEETYKTNGRTNNN